MAEPARVRVATFAADVTPPLDSVAPYGMGKPFNRVTDPLEARGIVILPEGQPAIVLCALDWVSVSDDGYDGFREALAAAAGTSAQRVAVQVVHQHGAPAGGIGTERLAAEHGLAGLHVDLAFTREAIARTAEAARQAVGRAVAATHVGVGKGRVERVASTRRIIGDDGKMKHWRGSGPARDPLMFELPEGLIDPDVRLVGIWNGETPVAALAYYATHPMSFYGDGELSADFAGMARRLRDAAVPGILHIYFNGGGGNLAAGKYNTKGLGSRAELAQRLADGMAAAWEEAVANRAPLTGESVAWRFLPVRLPLKANLTEERLLALVANPNLDRLERVFWAEDLVFVRRNGGAAPVELSRLTLGPAEILHYPGEPFVEYQLAAQRMRPDRFVCFAGYGEYGPAYISTEIGHFQGGFETERWCRTSAAAERVLLDATRDLLEAPPRAVVPAVVAAGAGPYARAVLEDCPMAYFRLGEADITAGMHDSSDAGLEPGAFYGRATPGEPGALAGDSDTAVRFDGGSGWGLASTTLANVAVKASFSVEAWARSATPRFETLAWFAGRRGPDGFLFGPDVRREGDRVIQGISGWIIDDRGNTDASVRSKPLPDGFEAAAWHHYALTYDAESDTAVIYLDGVPLASRGRLLAETGGRRSPEAMINLVVGRDDAMPHRFGNGWLDEIAVYDRALPPERVRLRHALGTGKRQP
ncbi:MAG: hypothetical protein BWZ02_00924 [Lentisphaerae bacterium ADurb.BinA184]|nr:MAG: hypothetical protein BWZ02_00924 [Lentisphaerae bacterium ADurb.BinA184]